jgi:hypothetical protein
LSSSTSILTDGYPEGTSTACCTTWRAITFPARPALLLLLLVLPLLPQKPLRTIELYVRFLPLFQEVDVSEGHVLRAIRLLDPSKVAGSLDFTRFLHLQARAGQSYSGPLKTAFDNYDSDADGFLDAFDIQNALLYVDEDCSVEEAQEYMARTRALLRHRATRARAALPCLLARFSAGCPRAC